MATLYLDDGKTEAETYTDPDEAREAARELADCCMEPVYLVVNDKLVVFPAT